jgi:hypothetical protein
MKAYDCTPTRMEWNDLVSWLSVIFLLASLVVILKFRVQSNMWLRWQKGLDDNVRFVNRLMVNDDMANEEVPSQAKEMPPAAAAMVG